MRGTFTIRDANVYDGTGGEPVFADIAVAEGIIADKPAGGPDIDAKGLAVAPGFIDSHTHDDQALIATDLAPKISQGVTTVITGNCGISLAPLVLGSPPPPPLNLLGGQDVYCYASFADLAARISRLGATVNAACLVGHTTLRVGTMERLDRPANAGEVEIMKAKLSASLETGAIGLSSGLEYAPARAASAEEITALASVCGTRGALYASHMRDEGDRVEDSLAETFAVGRKANVPVIVSHHECAGTKNFGRSAATLARISEAQTRQEIGLDAYPYDASSTILQREFLRGANRVLVTWSERHPQAAGRDLAELAREWRLPLDKAVDRLAPAGAVYFDMDEADVRRILGFPHTMIGSDGLPNDAHPHPRLWGTFPRVLGHYVRDIGLFPLAEAIRKMTSLPASRYGLKRRGRIAPGFHADLVLFDPVTVTDEATFAEPKRPARGIAKVWVNGIVVWDGRNATGERPGRFLRREAA
jgi:N-acyl-D-amino-acid deacylase